MFCCFCVEHFNFNPLACAKFHAYWNINNEVFNKFVKEYSRFSEAIVQYISL